MNAQLLLSYLGKASLVILPILVGAGVINQEMADSINELVGRLPDAVGYVLSVVTAAGSIYSIYRSQKANAKK